MTDRQDFIHARGKYKNASNTNRLNDNQLAVATWTEPVNSEYSKEVLNLSGKKKKITGPLDLIW